MVQPSVHVETNGQLRALVREAIALHGPSANLNHLNVACIQDFGGVFQDLTFSGDASNWDMRQAVSLRQMFQNCRLSADLSAWTFERLINMSGTFKATVFSNRVHLGTWNTSTVVDFANTFERTVPNQALGLHTWDTRSGVLFDQCFDHAWVRDDVSYWNMCSAQSWSQMFFHAHFHNPHLNLSRWDAREVRDFYRMFQSSNFKGNLNAWVMHNALDLRGMLWDTPFHGDLSSWTIRTDQTENLLDPLNFDKFNIPNVALWQAVLENHDLEDHLQPHLRAHLARTHSLMESLFENSRTRAQAIHHLYCLDPQFSCPIASPLPPLAS